MEPTIEIERRFLLKWVPDGIGQMATMLTIRQYYCEDELGVYRVRETVDPTKADGMKRSYHLIRKKSISFGVNTETPPIELSVREFELHRRSASRWIQKSRIVVPMDDGLKLEVDVFDDLHWHLVLAEIELPSIDHPFSIPVVIKEAIAIEVTGIKELSNYSLSRPWVG